MMPLTQALKRKASNQLMWPIFFKPLFLGRHPARSLVGRVQSEKRAKNQQKNTSKINFFFFPRSPFYSFFSLLKSLSPPSTFQPRLHCLLCSLRAESRENCISAITITSTILTTTSTKTPASGPTYSDLTPMATGKWSVLLRPPPLLPIKGRCCYSCPLSHMCHPVFCLYQISP